MRTTEDHLSKTPRADFSIIARDNEKAAAEALANGDFVKAFITVHALIEALLRLFLRVTEGREVTFTRLVKKYRDYLAAEQCPYGTFVEELTQFNRRRNRIVHELWRDGYTHTNRQAESAARGALVLYGLFIEWIQTFDDEIAQLGFAVDEPAR